MTASRRRRAAAPPRRRYTTHRYFTRSRRDKALGGLQDGRRLILDEESHRNKAILLKTNLAGSQSLKVKSVNLEASDNRHEHHTSVYDQEDAIFRRGQEFSLTIIFNRVPKAQDDVIVVQVVTGKDDVIVVQVVTGSKPQENKGTLIRVHINPPATECVFSSNAWTCKSTNISATEVQTTITPSPAALIGRYKLYVETSVKGTNKKKDMQRYEHEEEFYVIFNPWCPDDTVYMENATERDEYVMNESGRIWVGAANNNRGRPWNFGQFDEPCLDAALRLMDEGELADTARRNVTSIVRVISAMANSCDDDGVLEGRWTSTYPKSCTVPWAWGGSVAILQEYMKTGCGVKYGQCWVFSGIVTTLLRALGIPTRSVTNFESAHDCDSSMTIDMHYDADGNPLEDMNDSVWNFHVWNESWFRRPDLPPGYDGWQAHDATPQECSEGVMRCGPASMKAIKEGHVYLNYDCPFIFAEVNGDKVHWRVDEDGEMSPIDIEEHVVGRNISTKQVGKIGRMDLTNNYKYPEGSEQERKVVEFVNQFSSRKKENIYGNRNKDLKVDVNIPDDVKMGDDIAIKVSVCNKSREVRQVKITTTFLGAFYTGVPGKRLKNLVEKFDLEPDKGCTSSLMLQAKDYQGKLASEGGIQVFISCTMAGCKEMFVTQTTVALQPPVMDIKAPSHVRKGEEVEVTFSFTNPLNIRLDHASFRTEGAGLTDSVTIPYRNVIEPKETISCNSSICPRRLGSRDLVATFSSNQLTGVEGVTTIIVT